MRRLPPIRRGSCDRGLCYHFGVFDFRQAHLLQRLMVAWFALFVAVAVASPLIKPQAMEMVCSSSGLTKLAVQGDDGAAQSQGHSLDCALCLSLDAPPPRAPRLSTYAQPLGHALALIPAARIAALTGAPLPARGPPTLS